MQSRTPWSSENISESYSTRSMRHPSVKFSRYAKSISLHHSVTIIRLSRSIKHFPSVFCLRKFIGEKYREYKQTSFLGFRGKQKYKVWKVVDCFLITNFWFIFRKRIKNKNTTFEIFFLKWHWHLQHVFFEILKWKYEY